MITGERSVTAAKEKLGNFETFVKNCKKYYDFHGNPQPAPFNAVDGVGGV